jgi:ArsR family transcriptional regulator, arsenate/arsenite/antimonite-responsive transcriptional repressor
MERARADHAREDQVSATSNAEAAGTAGTGAGGCCVPLLASPLTEPDAVALARVFAALADPVRLRLLSLLAAHEEVCSCDLEGPLGKSQPTISHHTKALAEAGLIVGEKRGRWTWWRLVPDRLDAVGAALRL